MASMEPCKPCQMITIQRKTCPASQVFQIFPQNQHHCVQHYLRHQLSHLSRIIIIIILVTSLAVLFIFQLMHTASSQLKNK